MPLLTLGNPKTEKGIALGYRTAVLHLAPSTLVRTLLASMSDSLTAEMMRVIMRANMCPRATAGCIAACLNTAGRGGIFKQGEVTNPIQQARIARTVLYLTNGDAFVDRLTREAMVHVRASRAMGLQPVLRMNGTSDVDWSANDSVRFLLQGLSAMHDVALYDYTKRPELFARYRAASLPIDLTFSRAETHANKRDARRMISDGERVAVVFGTAKRSALPATHEGRPVVDGDASDLRFLDARDVVVGLRAKGRARRDSTGFVVRTAAAA